MAANKFEAVVQCRHPQGLRASGYAPRDLFRFLLAFVGPTGMVLSFFLFFLWGKTMCLQQADSGKGKSKFFLTF